MVSLINRLTTHYNQIKHFEHFRRKNQLHIILFLTSSLIRLPLSIHHPV